MEERSPGGSLADRVVMTLALALAVGLRAVWWTLPGLGRDEAFYVYWSTHPQLAYAPALQGVLEAASLFATQPWHWRLPNVAIGVLVLVLFERWLRARDVRARERGFAVALLALSPWQSYASVLVHPDDLQLAVCFGFALSVRSGRGGWTWLMIAIAPWTKPSGILISVVGLWWMQRTRLFGARTPWFAGLAAALALAPLLGAHAGLVSTLLGFARLEDLSWMARLAVLGSSVLLFAGPAAALIGVHGLVRGLMSGPPRELPRGPMQGTFRRLADEPERVLALVLVLAFVGAAVISGQVKGNWLMPGLFLAWPGDAIPALRRTRVRAVALLLSAVIAVPYTLAFARPDLVERLETAGRLPLPSYLEVAGRREARVAPATAWWHRVREYVPVSTLCAALDPGDAPSAIVSDDYGLAAQWAVQCPTTTPAIVLPLDTLLPPRRSLGAGTLVLAVSCGIEDLVGPSGWRPLAPVAHPITGRPIERAWIVAPIEIPSPLPPRERNTP